MDRKSLLVWRNVLTSEDVFWHVLAWYVSHRSFTFGRKVVTVVHIYKIHVKGGKFLCHFGYDCCWKIDHKIDYRLCKWFPAHILYLHPFLCLSSTWEMYSMQLHASRVCSQIYVTFKKAITGWRLWLLLSGCMGNILYALWKNIQLQQCVLRQRSKPTCLWVVSCEATDPEARAPLQHTMPSVCEKQPAAKKHCHWVG